MITLSENLVIILSITFLGILSALLWIGYRRGVQIGRYQKELEWSENIGRIRKEIADKQRSGIKGKISEVFAPYIEGFPFKASECKFIGDPIDYIVFEGLDERDVKAVHLVEIKTDSSKLSKHQKQIKDIIDSSRSGKVKFHEIRLDSEKYVKNNELEEKE